MFIQAIQFSNAGLNGGLKTCLQGANSCYHRNNAVYG